MFKFKLSEWMAGFRLNYATGNIIQVPARWVHSYAIFARSFIFFVFVFDV